MEENILNWLEVGDAIQKLDVYNKKFRTAFFKICYNTSRNLYFSFYFQIFLIIVFFAQIFELNLTKTNTENDKILSILSSIKQILLFEKIVDNDETYRITLISCISFYIFALVVETAVIILLLVGKHSFILIKLYGFIALMFFYYLNSPYLEIFLYPFINIKGGFSLDDITKFVTYIFNLIFAFFMLVNLILISFYIDDINVINKPNYKSKINDRYTTIILILKMIYSVLDLLLISIKENKVFIYLYQIIFVLINLSVSIYTSKKVYFYNNTIDGLHHFGWYFSTWFSICILFKNLSKTKDITLFVIIGFVLTGFSTIFNKKYKEFKLLTEFNILSENKIKDIEIYKNLLIQLSKQNDPKSITLLAGIIKKAEESLMTNPELYEVYNKFIKLAILHRLFNSDRELKALSIIAILYINNEEKSINKADISLNRCYFLIKKCKNITLATFIATKIITNSHMQAYYKYILLEEIKLYLINKLKKTRNKLTMKNIEISSVILYSQLLDLFKIEIYDAVCSQIEYFDILKNNISTEKATENFLKTGNNILSLRNNIITIWNKMLELNPLDKEAEKDYLIYLDVILKDEFLKKEEIKKYKAKRTEYNAKKNNLYFEMFNHEKSAILLCDGYSFNGKIFYYTPNFAALFGFTGKEISNISIEDLLPDVVQGFHKYLYEENAKYTNVTNIFKNKRNILLKGKNGLLFNIYIYIRIIPNMNYGLLYILYIQKIQEKNFMVILDNKMFIDGFTESGEKSSNFTVKNINSFGLSQLAIGQHIGFIIPDIIFHIDYDPKTENYFFTKENIDLKGFFFPTHNSKDMNTKMKKLLDAIKEKKLKENDEENNKEKLNIIDEYNDFIKEIQLHNKKSYSIFYRIECRSFLEGKYKYYKIYITNDLLSEDNLNDRKSNGKNTLLKDDENNDKETNLISENSNKKMDKLIKLKINSTNLENLKKRKKNNGEEVTNDNNNNENSKELNINKNKINFSQPTSNASSGLSKTNKETNEFHKLKNEIINKKDFIDIRLIKYLVIFYMIVVDFLIAYDHLVTEKKINSLAEFLRENLYFIHTKISCANTYNAALNLRLIRLGIIKNENCPNSNCTSFYSDLLVKSFTEVRVLKYDLNVYFDEYLDIFYRHKSILIVNRFKSSTIDYLNLDIDSYINFLTADGLKLIANITNYFNQGDSFFGYPSYEILDVYMDNLLNGTYNFFYSDLYNEFEGQEKTKRLNKHSDNPPERFIISLCLLLLALVLIIYLVYRIYSTECLFLDKLINFNSVNFEEYLKNLEELKKSLRDENIDDDDKNVDDIDENEGLEDKNDDKSLKTNKNAKKGLVKKKENSKKKKNRQNKLHLQKLKKRKNMSTYFFKINAYFIIKITISFIIILAYFIITILIFDDYKDDFKKFDESLVQINSIYFNIFKTFLNLKTQIEKLSLNQENANNIIIPGESELIQPKLGNALFNIIHCTKYTKLYLDKIKTLYNEDGCAIINENITTDKYCQSVFSSVLTKGLDQVIVQMSIIINNCIDEFNQLKADKNLSNIYSKDSYYYNYEILVGYYIYNSFLITKDAFAVFREDEKAYIISMQKIVTLVFFFIVLLVIALCCYFIYSYNKVGNSFWNFIGILPNKFISDDEAFYDSIIKLGEHI